jgi:signal transduction histidine kinase
VLAGLFVAFVVAVLLYLRMKAKKLAHARQLKTIEQEKEIQLLQAVMQGEEKERGRIAKDLHDGVAGMLAAVKMHLGTLETEIQGLSEKKGYQKGISLLNETTYEVRKTAHNLMPEVLMKFGLEEALRRYCDNISNSSALAVQFDTLGDLPRYKVNFELSVYRIVQELLNNIIKHARATSAVVQLSHQEDILYITVEDNGVGFQTKQKKDGVGLASIESRIKAMNGNIVIEGDSGSGVSAYLEFETSRVRINEDISLQASNEVS